MQRTKGIGLVALLAFLIFAMPRANIRVGPVPVYAIDMVAALILVHASYMGNAARRVRYPFRMIVVVMVFLCVISELAAILYGGRPIDAIYLTTRFFLAHAILLAVPLMVRSPADIELVLKAVAVALLINAGLMILTSLPMTRRIAMTTVFSIPMLDPASDQVLSSYLYEVDGDAGARGRTLVGVSIIGATYASIAWPLVAYLRSGDFHLSPLWRGISYAAVLLAPMGVVLSYSRGALAGAVLVVLAVLVLPGGRLRRNIIQPILYSVAVVAVVGVGSTIFFFDRYVNRFAAVIENPVADVRETDRLYSYIEPFAHVLENPQFLLFGEGLALDRLGIGEQEVAANHSLLGAGYYAHGMIWTFLFLFLILAAVRFLNRQRKVWRGHPGQHWPQALLLAYMPIFTLAAFAPGLANHPRTVMMYFLMLSLIVSLRAAPFAQAAKPYP
ncbi:hypothetical protein [Rhodophyticola sp.]|uniref:hypothetical protein n=1 Tax=Rhodophyticola sp. TaxID=2680032 RepID=UPI003D2E1DB4